ncbi:MAG: DNA topoisomerase VI subunit B [Candidatus Bathyarchaeota archaeon]|nr:DNA topoisomerase VI subunit B [Candidatus Bathyarchaeota archaeon]MCX8177562.1 DNA topoisomerase VI subunit B [Candidatus Bathyarchaeota archaeon]MDW8194348.1 DNA topoisomerase VI subunit B [Nitrososphaerota archaeon]
MAQATFEEISAADFFYRNRDIAGFTNPTRAIFAAIRELVENSLDAAESIKVPPDIYVRLSFEGEASEETQIYRLRVKDNGTGIPPQHIPLAFGQVLYGSKYKLKQQRGTFGLGGKMAILYGQITTHQPALIISSTGGTRIYEYKIMIDIQKNRPVILDRRITLNKDGWRGTIIEFTLEGDYLRAMPKILEYFKQTAMVNPYANLTFVDPKGRLYIFKRATATMPDPPTETLPHPYGVDVELLQRLIQITTHGNMLDFLKNHFHRVGNVTAKRFLEFSGISPSKNPKKLSHDEIVRLVQMLRKFKDFLPPDAGCLSPLGEELLRTGILKELKPEFLAVHQRKPATYSGHPFIVEVAIAYGGEISQKNGFVIYRFANRIPLLYDEASDVSVKVIESMNWRRYKVAPDMPIAIVVHICSTKVPYKTVGKEFIADRPEVRREIANGLREVARQLQRFLSRREHADRDKKRLGVFSKYLPRIAEFSTKLAEKDKIPDIERLLRNVRRYGVE